VSGSIGVLMLLVLVNVLSLGVMAQPEPASVRNPSMAGVLAGVVGPWGAILISAGLVVLLSGALLSWLLLCAEIVFSAARDNTIPDF
jgi:arginine:ornithine antiporter / lysine permease